MKYTNNGKPKQNKTKKSTRILTKVKIVQQPKPKKKSSAPKIGRNATGSASKYLELLSSPFSTPAFGAKLPDPYSPYTDAYRLHGEFKVVAPSGTTTAAYLIKPNPFCSIIDVQSWSGGVSTSSASGFTSMGSNAYMWGVTTPAALGSVMSNYRVVAMGIKIRLMIPQQRTTGRMIVARAPRSAPDPAWGALNSHVYSWANQTSAYSPISPVPPNPVLNSPFILELPESQEFSDIEMIGRNVTVVNSPNSYEAFKFNRLSGNATDPTIISGTSHEGEDIVVGTLLTYSYHPDNSAGWDDIYLYFDGLPIDAAPVCNIEYVIHLEGVPAISSATTIVAIPSHPPANASGSVGMDSILRSTSRMRKILFEDAPTAYARATGRDAFKDLRHASAMAYRAMY